MYELLFFDTFSHEVSDKVQLDLVQFPRPVQVTEVRAIPLGARVKADFPGGVRLGATNPSQFEIEFFVNDLSKRGAGTFESVGCLQYNQHGKIHMDFEKKVPTDGLLLRGNYNTKSTLAVYGHLTKVQREQTPRNQRNVERLCLTHLRKSQHCMMHLAQAAAIFHDPSEDVQQDWDTKVMMHLSKQLSQEIQPLSYDINMVTSNRLKISPHVVNSYQAVKRVITLY
nr:protein virilizer-like [Cherax quadricarinatus]